MKLLNSGIHPPEFWRGLWTTVTSGRVWSGEIHNRKKDGSPLLLDTNIHPVRDATGEVVEFHVFRDNITESRLVKDSSVNKIA